MSNNDNDNDNIGSDTDKLRAPADFHGPTEHRHCTDLLLLILILASWVAMTAIGIYAVSNGDYRLVVYPLDYDGNICGLNYQGSNADMTDYPYLHYINYYSAGVCVKECPDLNGQTTDNLTDIGTLITYAGIYQVANGTESELPPDFVQVGNYSASEDALECTDDLCWRGNAIASYNSQGINRGFGYAYYVGDTYEVLLRCYYTTDAERRIATLVDPNLENPVDTLSNLALDFWTKLYGDLWVARKYVLGFGFGGSVILSLGYIFLMRFPFLLTFLIWLSIFTTVGALFAGGYYAWQLASEWEDDNPQIVTDAQIRATTAASIMFWVLGALVVLLACCLRSQIQLAIGCVKEAGRCVNRMLLIFCLPVFQAIGFVAFLSLFTFYAVHLASLGEITFREAPLDVSGDQELTYRVYEFDDTVENMGWYLLFCLYWTANFIIAVGDLVIALCCAKWYFTREKGKLNSLTVLNSLKQVMWYHMGTAAYGSLILAIIQIIRTIIARAQKAAKKSKSKFAQAILCCCQCCFWCLEQCIKFLSKNAYIQTAIFSTAFCKSCRRAFNLIFRNAGRIAAISYVSGAILIVGKLFVSTVITVVAYFLMTEELEGQVSSFGGPMAIIFLCSYWISDMFFDVYDMAISTILQCFIADEEMFPDAVYAEGSLQRWVEKYGSEEEKNQIQAAQNN